MEFIKQLASTPGGKELADILMTPDSIFDLMWPEMQKELLTSQNRRDMLSSYREVRTPETDNAMIGMVSLLIETDELSDNKKAFVSLVFEDIVHEINRYAFFDVEIAIQLLNKNAKLPTYANATDAGIDIYLAEDYLVPGKSFGNMIPTGIAVAIPKGWQLSIRPRSGMSAKTKLRISNAPGTIDAGYRDEIKVLIDNFGDTAVELKAGDRIAQFIPEKVHSAKWLEVDNVKNYDGDRGGGFGSTDKEEK